jgi:hypothetical protein
MFYSKLRHAPSNSIIDISSIQHSKNGSSNQNRIRSQPRTSSYLSHHQLCHSYSDDSLDKDFIQHTKQTVDKLFRQTNFNETLDQIQYTLQPIAEQLRQEIQRKNSLSKRDRFICMKSCAKFITETLLNHQWNLDDSFTELYRLQHVLDHFLLNHISVHTNEQLVGNTVKETTNLQLPSKFSFVSAGEHQISPVQSTDDLTRQKNYHRSVSHAFKQLNIGLQKLNHEIPFQAHLSKYHKHNH